MEALVALGLASNVVQFVDFASKLIHTYSRLRQGVAQSEYEYHRTITNHLVPIAGKVKSSAQTIAQSSATLTPEQKVEIRIHSHHLWSRFLQATHVRCSNQSLTDAVNSPTNSSNVSMPILCNMDTTAGGLCFHERRSRSKSYGKNQRLTK